MSYRHWRALMAIWGDSNVHTMDLTDLVGYIGHALDRHSEDLEAITRGPKADGAVALADRVLGGERLSTKERSMLENLVHLSGQMGCNSSGYTQTCFNTIHDNLCHTMALLGYPQLAGKSACACGGECEEKK